MATNPKTKIEPQPPQGAQPSTEPTLGPVTDTQVEQEPAGDDDQQEAEETIDTMSTERALTTLILKGATGVSGSDLRRELHRWWRAKPEAYRLANKEAATKQVERIALIAEALKQEFVAATIE